MNRGERHILNKKLILKTRTETLKEVAELDESFKSNNIMQIPKVSFNKLKRRKG